MSNFKIIVTLNKNFFESELTEEIIYYTKKGIDYSDTIIFHNKTITITGSRKKNINHTDILETVNSTYYSCLIKALLYIYFEKGCFTIESIIVHINDLNTKEYDEKEIKQVFTKDRLLEVSSIKLFSNKNTSDTMMNALMNLTLSFNEQDLKFDYTWKCFNSLIRDIFNQKNDFEMLKKLREDLEDNPDCYPNILLFSDKVKCNYLDQCFLNAMICNNFPKLTFKSQKKVKPLVDFYTNFEDVRVLKSLKEKIKCKKTDLKINKEYNNVLNYYNTKISENIVKNTDVVRLIILKYAYYLRCKYFHAEKLPANFLINNANYTELLRISEPLSIICKDLLENKL